MPMFTTIAAGIGLAISAGTTAYSFIDAAKQRKLKAQAEREAEDYMASARKRLDVNYYRALAVKKEPYALERDALISAGAQAMEAATEAETRGTGATAGRLQMAQNEAESGVRTAMGKEQSTIDKMVEMENSRLRDIKTQLDLEETAGAQMAAVNAWQQEQKDIKEGVVGLGATIQQAANLVPLFPKNAAARKASGIESQFNEKAKDENWKMMNGATLKDAIMNLGDVTDPSTGKTIGLYSLDPKTDIMDWLSSQSPKFLNVLEQKLFNPAQ